jgi:AcrR family transcriptional regulator
MGVKERKAREKERLKNLILDTSLKIFMQLGVEQTSMRKIAAEIEYSPATLYLYFKDKDEIFAALQERAFMKFMDKLNEFDFIKDPLGRLKSIAQSYVEFAIQEPTLYDLIFTVENKHHSNNPYEQECYQLIRQTLSASMDKNLIKRMNVDEATLIFWSFLHGMVSLHSKKRLEFLKNTLDMREKLNQSVDRALEVFKPSYF